MNFIDKIKKTIKNAIDEKNKVTIAKAISFAKRNKDTCILVMDKNTDDIVVAFKDHYIATRLSKESLLRFKLKRGVVEKILNGKRSDKETMRYVEFIKSVMGEFLWQMNEHSKYDREYEERLKDGYSESFQTFMKEKRSEKQLSTKNKKDGKKEKNKEERGKERGEERGEERGKEKEKQKSKES